MMICLVVMMFTAGNLQAQMTAAKKILPAVEKKVILNAPAQKVWDYISEPENYKKFSGVKAFSCEEKALNAKIELTTKADKKRKQHIFELNFDQFKISYLVTNSDYDGDHEWAYSFNVLPKGNNKCELVVSIYYYEPGQFPAEFNEGITQEFNDIIAGVSKKFNK